MTVQDLIDELTRLPSTSKMLDLEVRLCDPDPYSYKDYEVTKIEQTVKAATPVINLVVEEL